MTAVEEVVLIDPANRVIGQVEKLRAHREGRLHRAFSVFVVDPAGALLLQRRALDKYHSGGRWSNTCCGHPRPGEELLAAAGRRLREEMGFGCALTPSFDFRYRARVGHDLLEHEHDTILVGAFAGVPKPDAGEVVEWKHEALTDIRRDVRRRPNRYTIWFRLLLSSRFEQLHAALANLTTQS